MAKVVSMTIGIAGVELWISWPLRKDILRSVEWRFRRAMAFLTKRCKSSWAGSRPQSTHDVASSSVVHETVGAVPSAEESIEMAERTGGRPS